MSIEVADLVASLGLDAERFDRGMAAAEVRAERGAGSIRLAFGTLGLAAAGVLVGMTKSAVDFESKTQTLANNTNMGAAGLAQMRQATLQLAQQTGQPLESLANGYMHIANHAYTGAAAMNIASAAAKNAAATGGDAGDDMNVLAGIMREYGISSKVAAANTQLATHYMDVLHNAVANSNFTMNDFVEGGKRAFATAGSFGVPISQVTAQLAILSEHGFPNASTAGQDWAGMLRSLEAPTQQSLKAMRSLSAITGVHLVADIKKLQQNGAFLPQFLADIQKATGGNTNLLNKIMSQAEYAQALSGLIRGRDELNRVQKLTDAAQMGRMLPGMVGTNEAFTAWSKTTAAQMQILRQTFEVLSVQVGSVFLPIVNRLLDVVAPFVQSVATWVGQHKELSAAILASVAALGTLSGGMAVLGVVAGPLVGIIAAIGAPLLVVGAAVAALAVAWQNNWGGIQQKTAAAWAALQPALQAIGQAIGFISDDLERFGVGAAASAGFSIFQALFSRFTDWLGSTALPAISAQLQAWGRAFTAWVPQAVPALLAQLRALGSRLWSWIAGTAAPAITAQLRSWGQAFLAWVPQAVPPMLAQLRDLASRAWSWITAQSAPLRRQLGQWASAFAAWVPGAAMGLVNKLGPMIDRLAGWINAQLPTLGQRLAAWGGAFWHWVRRVGPPLERELAKLAVQIGIFAVGAAAKFAIWLVPRLPAIAGKFQDLLTGLGQWILTTAIPELIGFGMDMSTADMHGMVDGFTSMGGRLKDAVGGAAGNMVGSFKDFLGIHSPSRVFHEMGVNMMQGWADGIAAHAPVVQSALARAAGALTMPGIAGGQLSMANAVGGLGLPSGSGRGGFGGGPVVVNVYMAPAGGATVTGTTGGHAFGKAVGAAVEEIARMFDAAEQRASSGGAPTVLPGARAS